MYGLRNPEASGRALPRGPHRLTEATFHPQTPHLHGNSPWSPVLGTAWESVLNWDPSPWGPHSPAQESQSVSPQLLPMPSTKLAHGRAQIT